MAISKDIIPRLQQKNLIPTNSEETLWRELTERCEPVQLPSSSNATQHQEEVWNVSDQQFGEITNDICIVFSLSNGRDTAKYVIPCYFHVNQTTVCRNVIASSLLLDNLKKQNMSCCLFSENNALDPLSIESKIATSRTTLVILTDHCLHQREVRFGFLAAGKHYSAKSRVILVQNPNFNRSQVHDASSCAFQTPPASLVDFFSEKAITFLSCTYEVEIVQPAAGYTEEGIQQIVKKFREEKQVLANTSKYKHEKINAEDIHTRVFLR